MDNNKLNHYKQRLLKLKSDYEQLEHNIIDNSNLNISEREEYEELSFYDNHPADLGEETYLRELNYSRLDSVKNILNSINDALKRIDENSFGFCKTCGRVIEEERLEIMPYAAYCIKCEKKHEQLSAENTNFRPIEEKNFPNSFGDTNMDYKDENVEFDGEDSYQSLERFNKTNDPSYQTGDQINIGDEVQSGTVEATDNISNAYYKEILENERDNKEG